MKLSEHTSEISFGSGKSFGQFWPKPKLPPKLDILAETETETETESSVGH
jgi:hypothetical protein